MIFCDTSYLVRIYLEDIGWQEVRELCASDDVATAAHAAAEIPAALHRSLREGRMARSRFDEIIEQFRLDCEEGAYDWKPLTREMLDGMRADFLTLPPDCFLRAGNAMHLACARDYGFTTIYSNDKNLLAAAKHFGIRGRNVIGRRS